MKCVVSVVSVVSIVVKVFKKQVGHLPHKDETSGLVFRAGKCFIRKSQQFTFGVERTIVVYRDFKIEFERSH